MNGHIMSGSHARKRQYPDGAAQDQAPVEKRQARRELPANMPPAFAQSYRQKQELLDRMFHDARKLIQMESTQLKNTTCKYGNICGGASWYVAGAAYFPATTYKAVKLPLGLHSTNLFAIATPEGRGAWALDILHRPSDSYESN